MAPKKEPVAETTRKPPKKQKPEPELSIEEHLVRIQSALIVPKTKENKFGGFKYRSAELILEALKPLTPPCLLVMDDSTLYVEGRFYSKATATLSYKGQSITVSSMAREEEHKKGMDGAQVTGASISYARKYALGAMFLIDDGNDPDSRSQTPVSNTGTPDKKVGKPNLGKPKADTQKSERDAVLSKISDAAKKIPTEQRKKRLTELCQQATNDEKSRPLELSTTELKVVLTALQLNGDITEVSDDII